VSKFIAYAKVGRVVWFISALSVFTNIYISTQLFNLDYIARERDKILVSSLLIRMADVQPLLGHKNVKLAIAGKWEYETPGPIRKVHVFGSSFFEESPYRVAAYLRYCGIPKVQMHAINQVIKYGKLKEFDERPIWPAKNSVFLVGDTVVVKFSELTPKQLKSIHDGK
jgi:hypothetical protein